MPKYFESLLDADEEVRSRAEELSSTISPEDQARNYELLRPVLEAVRSPSPPSKGLRTSITPPLFPASQCAYLAPEDRPDPSQAQIYIPAMPSLSPEEFEEQFGDVVNAVLSSSSSQEERSQWTSSTATNGNFSEEARQSIEQKEDDGEIKGDLEVNTSLHNIIRNAKENFDGKKPSFVLSSIKIGSTKMLAMENDQTAEMTFVAWDKSKNQGYWVLEDNYNDKHIVKYFKQGNCYKEWVGTEAGFAEEPIAWPVSSGKTRSPSVESDLNGYNDADQDSDASAPNVKRKAENNSHHNLRGRTWTQENPYSADKEIYAATKRGRVKRKADIDARKANRELKSGNGAKRSRNTTTLGETFRAMNESSKPPRSISTSTTILSDKRNLDPEALRVMVFNKTTLRTTLPGDEDTVPLRLSECPDEGELWAKVLHAWKGEYEGEVKSLSITFSWLGPEYNIKLKPGFSSSYDKMIEEVQENQCWADGTDKCTVDVRLNVA